MMRSFDETQEFLNRKDGDFGFQMWREVHFSSLEALILISFWGSLRMFEGFVVVEIKIWKMIR